MRKVNKISLERKDDLLYFIGEEQPFTGQYTYYHDNGERAEQAQVKDGLLHGNLSIWKPNGEYIPET
jgi:antitoxin component YwqK of YwqJK toxin-antitoxin module